MMASDPFAEFVNDHVPSPIPKDDPNVLIRIRRGVANLGELTDHEQRPAYHVVYQTASGEAEWILPMHAGVPAVRTLATATGEEFDQRVPSGLTVECLIAIAIDHLRTMWPNGPRGGDDEPLRQLRRALEGIHTYINHDPAPVQG